MAFSLAPFLGDGSELNPFRPGVGGPYAVIDLRADSTQQAGWCLLKSEVVPSGATDLGERLDETMPRGVSRGLENALGVSLDQTDRLRSIIAELLILHGDNRPRGSRTRWRPLKATSRGRHRIRMLGESIYDAPAPVGTTITETWTTADSDDPSGDNTWAEVAGDWDVLNNQLNQADGGSNKSVRCEVDLASDDHYAQAEWDETGSQSNSRPGVIVRFASAAETFYAYRHERDGDPVDIIKLVSGSGSIVAAGSGGSLTDGDLLRLEADGSSLESFHEGASTTSTTDTDITGNTRCGCYSRTTAINAAKFDNFEAGDLAAFSSASLLATGDGTIVDVVNENDAATPLSPSVDDDPASPTDTDWINNAVDVVP